jgi:hypothetical protein
MSNNPLIDPVILAHVNLDKSVKEHGGILRKVSYGPAFYQKVSDGRIRTDLSQIVDLIGISITFPQAACMIAFLASGVMIAWIKAKANRSIELQCGDTKIIIKGTNDIEQAKKLYQDIVAFEKPTKCDE